ncbi:hypothetical protein LCGC14_3055800 [marine sediment metagenome]|uniref:Uncharacterized protein n=1 Tax=marine sediment metagenome TaxID=412755 RepID=A0A0F8ZB57_9ZZZZ
MAIGDIGSVLDTFKFGDHTNGANNWSPVKLSEGIIVISYSKILTGAAHDNSFIRSYPIDSSGNIGSLIDSWEEAISVFGPPVDALLNVSGDIFATAYRDNHHSAGDDNLTVITFSVDKFGVITKSFVEQTRFTGVNLDNFQPQGFVRKIGTNIYIFYGFVSDSTMFTVKIDADGTSITQPDNWTYVTGGGTYHRIIHITGDMTQPMGVAALL